MERRTTGEGPPSYSSDFDTNERSDRSNGRSNPNRFVGYDKQTAEIRGRRPE